MAKLTREQKIEIYEKRKSGQTISALAAEYRIRKDLVQYLVRLIAKHGTEILREDKNRYYSPEFKLEVINRILIDRESTKAVSIELGLSSNGMIRNWIKKYQENGYNVIERKRGRPSMTKSKTKQTKPLTVEEELEELKKKNQYLEAENEYLKKLNAVVNKGWSAKRRKSQSSLLTTSKVSLGDSLEDIRIITINLLLLCF